MSDSNFETWLERQNELVDQAVLLIRKYKFKAFVMERERKSNFIRIQLRENRINVFIKEVKSKFVRSVWLVKKDDFEPKSVYLLYAAKEDKWYATTSAEVDRDGEYKDSSYKAGVQFIVVPTEIFRHATTFLKGMRKRYDAQLQRRMTEWT